MVELATGRSRRGRPIRRGPPPDNRGQGGEPLHETLQGDEGSASIHCRRLCADTSSTIGARSGAWRRTPRPGSACPWKVTRGGRSVPGRSDVRDRFGTGRLGADSAGAAPLFPAKSGRLVSVTAPWSLRTGAGSWAPGASDDHKSWPAEPATLSPVATYELWSYDTHVASAPAHGGKTQTLGTPRRSSRSRPWRRSLEPPR